MDVWLALYLLQLAPPTCLLLPQPPTRPPHTPDTPSTHHTPQAHGLPAPTKPGRLSNPQSVHQPASTLPAPYCSPNLPTAPPTSHTSTTHPTHPKHTSYSPSTRPACPNQARKAHQPPIRPLPNPSTSQSVHSPTEVGLLPRRPLSLSPCRSRMYMHTADFESRPLRCLARYALQSEILMYRRNCRPRVRSLDLSLCTPRSISPHASGNPHTVVAGRRREPHG